MRTLVLVTALVAITGCEDPVVVGPSNVRGSGTPTTPPATPGPATATTETAASPDGGVGDASVRYADDDFVEADLENRDPFRSFAYQLEGSATPVAVSRYVKMGDLAIEEMRLIAIVTGTARPYAMVVDRENMGHVIEVRDYIGRPEIVQTGGTESMPIQLNWRVDRIRDGEVVLAREDPTAPNQPPVFRTMPLRPEGESASPRGIVTGPSRASDPASGTNAAPAPTQGYRLLVAPPERPAPTPR